MKFRAMILSIVVLFSSALSDAATEKDYLERLEYVEYLAEHLDPGGPQRLGIWAGIYFQTQWQLDTNRYPFAVWHRINRALTEVPYRLFLEFQENPNQKCVDSPYVNDNPTRSPFGAPVSQIKVCESWFAYFESDIEMKSLGVVSKIRLQRILNKHLKKLWRAHFRTVDHELWQHQKELKDEKIPHEERQFWKGWIELVEILAQTSFPTYHWAVQPLQGEFLPDCGLLGTADCLTKDLRPVARQIMTRLIRFVGEQRNSLSTSSELGRIRAPFQGP